MKTLNKIIILILFFSNSTVFPQSVTFKKVFPAFDISVKNSLVLCKPFNNDKTFLINGTGMRLIKINEYGAITLLKNYLNYGYFIHPYFKDNGTIIFYSDYGSNKKLLKLDTSLNFMKEIQYDSINTGWQDIGFQFHVDNSIICAAKDNGYILSGTKHYLIPLIVKTDSSGNVEWGEYFTPIQGGIQDIIQTQDSGFIVAANLKSMGASLIKINSSGNVLWCKSYFRPRGYIHNVLENADGTMLITGNIDSLVQYGSEYNSSPLFFIKLNNIGNVIWAKTFGDTVNRIRNNSSYTKCTQDGGYISLATLAINNWLDDLVLIKTDTNGDTLWTRAHGSIQSKDYGQSVEQLNDKGFIISGITNNNIPVTLSSLYIVRTDSLGHTDSLCEEYSLPLAINNITVNDSDIIVTSVPFTVTTSIPDTSTQSFTTYAYDGCHLDDIPELYAEQTAPLLIYPNPTDGVFSIETKMSTPIKTEIEIYNINGRKIYSGFTNESYTAIDLTGNAKGLYFVRMSNERFVKTGKVMIY